MIHTLSTATTQTEYYLKLLQILAISFGIPLAAAFFALIIYVLIVYVIPYAPRR